MSSFFPPSRRWLAALLPLGLAHCVSPPLPDEDPREPPSQQVSASAVTTTDFACASDADCTRLASSCGASACDPASHKCTLTPKAVEGTACGDAHLCDHVGRCLPCGGAADSTHGLVQTTIYDSPRHGCNATVCHGSGPGQAQLNLSAGKSYSQTVGVKAVLNPNMDRIRPGDTVNSYVYRKIYWATSGIEVPGGSPMPAGGAPPVPTKLVNALREWIALGAPEKGFLPSSVAKFCEAPCVRNAECSNGNLCDGEEVCNAGKCEPGTPKTCDDGDACTADRCDPVKGCKAVVAPGLPCAEAGVCDDAGTCQTCSAEPGSTTCTLPEVVTGKLVQSWEFAAPASVSSTPLPHEGTLYVTAWNGYLYALDQRTGAKKWELDTQEDQAAPQPVHGGVIAAPDGGLLFGDGNAMIWKVDASGKVLWKSDQQETGADHVWSNLTVSEGLVFVPIASHSDVPCTKGRTVALDLATGKQVWARYNVPRGGICRTDTAVACSADADCPGRGKCEDAVGGAV